MRIAKCKSRSIQWVVHHLMTSNSTLLGSGEPVPRLPVTGAQELRITLGGTERRLLEDLSFSYRIQTVSNALTNGGEVSILEILADWKTVVALAYGLATALEIVGIETPIPTPVDAFEFLNELKIGKEQEGPSAWELLSKLWSGEFGGYPGGY